jgi:hypothetical protein
LTTLTEISGFGGQLIKQSNVPSLILMHDMVATAPSPASWTRSVAISTS